MPFVPRVVCLGCGSLSRREDLQSRFNEMNPGWAAEAGGVAPDGDVFLEDEQVLHFRVPSCQSCGGSLKPEVTFFGDTVDRSTVQLVHDRLAESDALLVAGSSLQVGVHSRAVIGKQLGLSGFVGVARVACLIPDPPGWWRE